jgi:hypothetical protein
MSDGSKCDDAVERILSTALKYMTKKHNQKHRPDIQKHNRINPKNNICALSPPNCVLLLFHGALHGGTEIGHPL